jgi:hypothetical protein
MFKFPHYIPQIIALNILVAVLESLNRDKPYNALLGLALAVYIFNIKWNESNPSKLIPFLVLYFIWNVWFCDLFITGPYVYSFAASNIIPFVIAIFVLYGNKPELTLFDWTLVRAPILLTMMVHGTKEYMH